MSTQVQSRRGTTTQHSTFTGAAGEVTVDTDKNVTVVHDGSTPGGHPTASEASVANKLEAGDNISLLNNDAGYITASQGGDVSSVNGQTGAVVLDADDINDAATVNKFATAAQLSLADNSVQPADNISTLTNDAGYITLAQVPPGGVTSVAGKTGAVTLVPGDVGLGNVDNTSDLSKPISTATQTALNNKADLVSGTVPTSQLPAVALSDFRGIVASESAMTSLNLAREGDWCYRSDIGDPYILIQTPFSNAANWLRVQSTVAVVSVNGQTGTVVLGASDVGAATTAQGAAADSAIQPGTVNPVYFADQAAFPSATANHGAIAHSHADAAMYFAHNGVWSKLANDGDLATVAKTGSYNDLSNKPSIPVVDPDTVVTDTAPTFTATVQTTERTITAGAFDLATGNHWTCGAITVPAPTNATAGTSGLIRITAGPVVWNAVFKFPGGAAPTIASFPAVLPFYVQDSSNILMGNVAEGIA